MERKISGMSWESEIFTDGCLDKAASRADAVSLMRHNAKEVVWNTITCFEGIPISLPKTAEILEGYSVSGLTISDLLKVKQYGHAVSMLCDIVEDGKFLVSKSIACTLHSIAAKEEVVERGQFRTRLVELKNVSFKPPHPMLLQDLWDNGIKEFTSIDNPLEYACALFLFMSRTQFFYDCNKRTAMLMANGVLMDAGIKPFFIPLADRENFAVKLAAFYESGHAQNMMSMLRVMAEPEDAAAAVDVEIRSASPDGNHDDSPSPKRCRKTRMR